MTNADTRRLLGGLECAKQAYPASAAVPIENFHSHLPTINKLGLVALGGDPNARYACMHPDGSLYFCLNANLDEERERAFWEARGMVIKRVVA